ncbi:MAG: glycoside hydrolase family 9 protein [Cyclobacteriaceae bacterium]|nr:glycoside hydrolase family 9 protein [Cyclobacteriaceae bacterium]
MFNIKAEIIVSPGFTLEENLKMKTSFLFAMFLLFQVAHAGYDRIRINQTGYYPEAPKNAIVVDVPEETGFEIVDESGKIVFSGPLSEEISWDKSGETVRRADFSALKTPGTYRVKAGEFLSWPFEISTDSWRRVAVAIAKSYYLQRASFELEEKYAGPYRRPAGHADTRCVLHPSSGKSGTLNAPGGWYDAGDFGKYVVSAGVTLGNMLSIMEMLPALFPDGCLNIPESGNGLGDLLDEAKYELDWFKYMQDEDGGVFVKITSEKYPDMMFPHLDPLQRNVYGKSTASTLHFAAVMAMAARLYNEFDADWSSDCLKRAEHAWQWAVANDGVIFSNPPGVLSGAYSNRDMEDEFLWAASELFITTNNEKYKDYLAGHQDALKDMAPSGWANVMGLAVTGLAIHSSSLPSGLSSVVKNSLTGWADARLEEMDRSAYRIPEFSLVWGSNGFIGSTGLCLFMHIGLRMIKNICRGRPKSLIIFWERTRRDIVLSPGLDRKR